jgi:hypothetical protein
MINAVDKVDSGNLTRDDILDPQGGFFGAISPIRVPDWGGLENSGSAILS